MEIKNIKTYNSAPEKVFETLCSQLFENWLHREFTDIKHFSIVNGAGGDGGVEAYAIRENKSVIGLQAKWFTSTIMNSQITQISDSIITAKTVRPELNTYIVCIPRETNSKKKGRNNNINSNTEEERLNSLIKKINHQFKDLDIIFWKENRLISELRNSENDGLVKLLFDKEELSFETLITRFDLAKSSWLLDRYFPDLHNQDGISKVIDEILVSEKYLKDTLNAIQEQINNLAESLKLIKYYILKNKLDEPLNIDLKRIRDNFELYLNAFKIVKSEIKVNRYPSQHLIEEVKLYSLITKLEQTLVPNILKETHRKLKNLLFHLNQVDLSQYIDLKRQYLNPHNYIILGEPGAGKTHSVAFEVESRLKREEPALLIRAKDSENLTWKKIISDTLQCCSDWSDIEILSAFSSLARRKSVSSAGKNKKDKFFNHNSKFLICVDGIDESPNPEKWKDLINETKVWLKKFPNVRFVFTCRGYPSLNQNPFSLPHDGDKIHRKDIYIENYRLAFDYLSHFNIKYENTLWIISSFENNLALRLFCEEYKGEDLSKKFKNPVFNSSSTLLQHKVVRLDKEFNKKLDRINPGNEKYVKKSLGLIVKLFTHSNKIEKSILRSNLFSYLDEVITKREINLLLDLLGDSGFIIYHNESTQNYGDDKEYYEIGIQSYFDYLLADEFAKNIVESKQNDIPEELLDNKFTYIRTLTGLALLNNKNLLVGHAGLWTSNFSDWELLKLQFDILSLAPHNILEKYEPFLKKVLFRDRDRFIEHFALRNSFRLDFNISENIVHKFLLAFSNTYERDLFWSGPDNHDINGHSHLSFLFEHNSLFILSKYNQAPLLYAWALSTTSRPIGEKIKCELTNWALIDLDEFVKLLEIIFHQCEDGQIQEGLSTVIYGLSSLINSSTPGSSKLIGWIKNEIFQLNRIDKIKNSVIRHSCRCFIERSYKLGLCDIETYKLSLPPYKFDPRELLCLERKSVLKQSGIYPIEHDLYWDKIKYSYSNFVKDENRKLSSEIKELFKLHKFQNAKPKDFFVRVAIHFLKDLGWNKEGLYGDFGDRQFMTFEEKYTNLAIHHIQGFLADRIKNNEHGSTLLTDYSIFLHINNPAHKSDINIDYLNNNFVKWFVPEDISPIINSTTERMKEKIKDWTTDKSEYDFNKWLFPKNMNLLREESRVKDKWLVLDSYIALSDPNKIGRTWLEINCVLMDENNYTNLTILLKNSKIKLDSDSFNAGIKGHTYNSLLDVIWRDHIIEYDQEITVIDTETVSITAYPSVTKLTERSESDVDINYNIPSAKLREILGINYTDKTSFSNDNKLLIINHSAYEDNYNNQKMLLIDKEYIFKTLESTKLFPVWICTEFRSTMDNPTLNKNKAHWQNCRKWICIGAENSLETYLIHSNYYR